MPFEQCPDHCLRAIESRERETLYKIIGGLANGKTVAQIEAATTKNDHHVPDRTLRKHLSEIAAVGFRKSSDDGPPASVDVSKK